MSELTLQQQEVYINWVAELGVSRVHDGLRAFGVADETLQELHRITS